MTGRSAQDLMVQGVMRGELTKERKGDMEMTERTKMKGEVGMRSETKEVKEKLKNKV